MIREQCALDIQLMEERLSTNFNSKFDRIEWALAAMAPNSDTQPATESRPPPPKRPCQVAAATSQRPQVHDLIDNAQGFNSTSHNLDYNPGLAPNDRAVPNGKDTELVQTRPMTSAPSTLTFDSTEPALTPVQNNNKPKTSWIISRALSAPKSPHHIPPPALPTSASEVGYDDDIEAKVSHILSSTAHHLSASTGMMGLFPHKFVQHGPEHKHAAFNMMRESFLPSSLYFIIISKK